MWTLNYIFSQLCVLIAVICLIATYFTRNHKIILILCLVDVVSYIIQFVLLEAYTGALMNCVGLVRVLWLWINNNKGIVRSRYTVFVLNIMSISLGVVTFDIWFCVFAIIAEMCDTYALWCNSVIYYRWISLFASVFWIIYFIFCLSVFAIALESVLIVIAIISLFNYYFKNK